MPEESSAELLVASSYEITPGSATSATIPNLTPGSWLPAGSCLGFLPDTPGIRQAVYTRQGGHIVALRYQTANNRLTVFVAPTR